MKITLTLYINYFVKPYALRIIFNILLYTFENNIKNIDNFDLIEFAFKTAYFFLKLTDITKIYEQSKKLKFYDKKLRIFFIII